MKCILALSISLCAAFATCAAITELPNGGVWKDTDGVMINAHGGALMQDGDTWYWYGEHKTEGKEGNKAWVGVSCYSSKNLLDWKNEGTAFKVATAEEVAANPKLAGVEAGCILERPKVIKTQDGSRYVMYFHLEPKGQGYGGAQTGIAESKTPTGPFTLVWNGRPNAGADPVNAKEDDPEEMRVPWGSNKVSLWRRFVKGGQMSRDMTLYADPKDGTVYHIFASEENSCLHLAELRPDGLGYTDRWWRMTPGDWTEAPAVVKHGEWYYLLGSGCTGWRPNAAHLYRAKSIQGPWERIANPCRGGKNVEITWNGQSTGIFTVNGTSFAMFDQWRPSNAIDGRYVWLPISFSDRGTMTIDWRENFTPQLAEPWQDEYVSEINRLPARSMMDSNLPANRISLDGEWDFEYVNGTEVQRGKIAVPSCWQLAAKNEDGSKMKVDPPLYSCEPYPIEFDPPYVMTEPKDKTWTSYTYRNPHGIYRKKVQLPASWANRRVILRLRGYSSAVYVRVNGKTVGYGEDGRLPNEWDLTTALQSVGRGLRPRRADRDGEPGVFALPRELRRADRDGEPGVFALPSVGGGLRPPRAVPGCVSNDDFSSDKLKLEWQWNHNPDNANWKIADGAMKITTSRVDQDLLTVRNILTQRTFGPTCEATVKVDGSALKVGDKVGLSLFQHHWGAISLQKTEKGYDVVLDLPPLKLNERRIFRPNGKAPTREVLRRGLGNMPVLYLKAVCDFSPLEPRDFRKIPDSQDTGRFYYSTDGQHWEAVGEAMVMPYTVPHFTGYRFALFNWATKEAGGTASFDDFALDYAKPGETMKMDGTNPIVKTRFTADPAGYVDGEYFYLFTGHDDAMARGYRMFDYTMCRTKDMKNWEDFGTVLNLTQVFPWARADKAWASQVIKRNNKWYWYIATAHKQRRGDVIAVAVADKPEGPWTDAAGENGLAQGWGFIDPSVFVDDDGSAWLFWGNCGGNPGCWYAPLKSTMVELGVDGSPSRPSAEWIKSVPGLMDASAFGEPLVKRRGAGHRKDGSKNTNFEEAPWIYKVGDTYYLEYAAGGVPENWSYSTAKSIHGPWTFRGKIMENAGGTGTIHGGSVFFKGQWYMVYHDGNLPGGADCRRSACIEPYTRNPDGSIPFIKPTRKGVAR